MSSTPSLRAHSALRTNLRGQASEYLQIDLDLLGGACALHLGDHLILAVQSCGMHLGQ
jgi:hypothetical protein